MATAVALVLLAGCGSAATDQTGGTEVRPSAAPLPAPAAPTTTGTTPSSAPGAASTTGTTPVTSGAAATPTLVTMPGGIATIDGIIASARQQVDLTMYELADPEAESLLEADQARGVAVRVILQGGSEKRENEAAYQGLTAHGVDVVWASDAFTLTHQKTLTVDGQTSVIMTLNLTSRYYPTTRDFAVVDHDPADVAAIETVFEADFAGRPVVPSTGDGDLVWSPEGSETALLGLIGSAHHTLDVESEEMSAPDIISALAAAARRGVSVSVVMTADPSWDQAFATLTAAGVKVATYPADAQLYIHAKMFVVDGVRAFVGSENLSTTSLEHNRELGIITSDTSVVQGLTATFAADRQGAQPVGA